MIDFLGSGNEGYSNVSLKSNIDNYYAYTQTSGRGNRLNGSSRGNGWTIVAIILFAIQVFANAGILGLLAVLGLFGAIALIIYLIRRCCQNMKKGT